MPWKSSSAKRFTRKAKSAVAKRQWMHVANSMMRRGMTEARAVRAANSVIKRRGRSK